MGRLYFKLLGHWYFWGTRRGDYMYKYRYIPTILFYVLCKPRGGLEVSESGPTSLLKDSSRSAWLPDML